MAPSTRPWPLEERTAARTAGAVKLPVRTAEATTSRARAATQEEVFGSSPKPRGGDDEDDVDLTSVFSNLRGGRHDEDEE